MVGLITNPFSSKSMLSYVSQLRVEPSPSNSYMEDPFVKSGSRITIKEHEKMDSKLIPELKWE